MNILITSAGRRVSLVKAFQKELEKDSPESKVFAVDLEPHLSAACIISDESFKVHRVNAPSYIDELINLCERKHVDIVIPTIDTELPYLSQSIKKFKLCGIHVVVSESFLIEKCRDKRKTDKLFKELNIPAPEIYDTDEITFPVYVKPYDGSNSQDNFLIHEESELTEEVRNNSDYLFCEYLDHATHQEYTLDLYFGRDSKLKCIVPRKRIEVRGGEVNKGLTVKNKLVPFVKERMAYLKGARGCLTMQLFLNTNTGIIKGIEINPRFGGGYPLSYLAGANYPKWIIQEYRHNESLSYWDSWEDNLLMLRYDDEVLVHGFESN